MLMLREAGGPNQPHAPAIGDVINVGLPRRVVAARQDLVSEGDGSAGGGLRFRERESCVREEGGNGATMGFPRNSCGKAAN